MKRISRPGCRSEDLVLYHYGELTGDDSRLLETHLEGCSACRDDLNDLRRTLAAIPVPPLVLSPGESRLFAEKVVAKTSRRRFAPPFPALGGMLAAAAAVLIFLSFTPGPSRDTVSPSATAELEMLQHLELLKDLELLEHLDLLQELEGVG